MLEQILNDNMHTLVDWLRANRLSLNIGKTHYIVFSPKSKSPPDLNIRINNIGIDRVRECKFLGIIIDEKLNWKSHTKYISSKIAKTIGILNKARKVFDQKILITLYYAFLYPLILYGNIAWGNAAATTIQPIYCIQKIAIRIMTNSRRRDRLSPKFKKLRILKVPDIYTLSGTAFMHQYINGKVPSIMQSFFTPTNQTHKHNTRNTLLFKPPLMKTKLGSKFIRKTGIDLLSNFSKITKNEHLSFHSAKRRTIDYILEGY